MILLLASLAFAEGPQYTKISGGESAPFSGFLLDQEALTLLVMNAKTGLGCPAETDYQSGLMEAKKNKELNMLISEHELEISIIESTKMEQAQRIEKLEKLKKPVSRGMWVTLGAALGVGTTIAIANAVN
jgi:hypothetical protein